MPPQVQTLDQILAELETAYAPTRNIYQQQASLVPAKFDTRRSALEGARVKNFDNIATSANRAGMGFTGFTQAEQGDYLADKFLPGMQQSYVDQDQEALQFSKSLAELDMEKRLKGMSRENEQKSARSSWEENERKRAFDAEQNRLDRSASAAKATASKGPVLSKNKSGGWEVSEGLDLAGYARATGADLITLLEQGDAQDRKAAQYYKDNIRLGRGETYAMDRLRKDRKTAFYRGG